MEGVIVPLVTPFKEDYSIDFEALEWHIEFLEDKGVHGIFTNSTTGEFTSLSFEEKKLLAEKGRELTSKAYYLVGTGSTNTFEVIELTKHAKDIGADATVIVSPYYCKLKDEAIFRHFSIVAERADIPIILYAIPSCANPINVEIVRKLALEHSNIIGIKASVDSLTYLGELLEVKEERKDFKVFTGLDQYFFTLLTLGGDGGIMACANFAPEIHLEIWNAFKEKNFRRAIELARELVRITKIYKIASSFASAVKLAMVAKGFPIRPVLRPPYVIDGEEVFNEIREIVEWRQMLRKESL
ncbi:dihydrodipicolinate synthase family protein [Pyrococcus furiosus DSM 3638]|uniref:Uncharacterized DapA-like lyase PF0657 n=3 Tax=Pyrococcus furiosus TaxID=2261 RepID=DAPAL_PYRFU|nr:dihydrodipicolinate synthase family protein [Pyrococcus furiosus]Q8U319.1 RecName: Full=Uncharacterized DapA-like lyase PF0657 [Pyrococcus furiosus DSM 3638]AAL80781.1 putative dihydrodipicolinate synthase [Pyrococcus furiosus DSM 3638]AFN03448.1 dihydrodipicolinate synthase [Pyrococcus furiosus COM1]QEK78356.1 dihydrodipicolinate synthase family protein [Pyrococcus furiosus DSM 3638]